MCKIHVVPLDAHPKHRVPLIETLGYICIVPDSRFLSDITYGIPDLDFLSVNVNF